MKKEKTTLLGYAENKQQETLEKGTPNEPKPQKKIIRIPLPRSPKPRVRSLGVPCFLKPEKLTPYPAILREYGLRRRGYAGYRVLLNRFSEQYAEVVFRGMGNGKDVVCGYVVDKQGNIESYALFPGLSDGHTVLPLTPNSYALYATVPLKEKQPLWNNIVVKLNPRPTNDPIGILGKKSPLCFVQKVYTPLVH